MTAKPNTSELTITDEQVAEYLSAHDDFFEGKPELLLSQQLPHAQKNSISLFEKQATLMRDREARHHRQIKTLISTARRNDQLLEYTRNLVVRLLMADNMQQVIEQTQNCFSEQFGMDFVAISTFDNEILDNETSEQHSVVAGLMSARKPVLGTLRSEELEYLFADNAAAVGSAAVYCLRDPSSVDDCPETEKTWGLLSLGSKDPAYFDDTMDSLFLEFVGDILVQLFGKYTD